MISLVGPGRLFVHLLLSRVIRNFTCAETFGDGILSVAVPAIDFFFIKGP